MNLMDKLWALLLLVVLTQGYIRLPGMLDLPIKVYMGPSWRQMFPRLKGRYEAKKVLSITRKLFQHRSLRIKFFLSYSDQDFIGTDAEIDVTHRGLHSMEDIISEPDKATAFVYLSAARDFRLGIAYPGFLCDKNKKLARAMVNWDGSTSRTAQNVAHELGHILGIDHDFETYPRTKISKRTRTCGPDAYSGGPNNQLMNFGIPLENSWSDCSNEDFLAFFKLVTAYHGSFCLEEHQVECYCGLAKRQAMMVGGIETEVNEYPWQVGIVWRNESNPWCGGALISNMWVLSAAHCMKSRTTAPMIQALLGEHDVTSTSESDMVRMDICEIVNHPNAKKHRRTFNYDITLLKLKTNIDFNFYQYIRPICLPENDDMDYATYSAIITGWGQKVDMGKQKGYESDNLLQAELSVLSNDECNNNFNYTNSRITDQMMCTHVAGGGTSPCRGDSGGPVITSGTDNGETPGQNYELIGVVSWSGKGCGNALYPNVNTRVTKQLGWIMKITRSGWSTCSRI